MDPQFLGLLSLAFAGAVQLAGISFLLGGLFQRVRALEARTRDLESGGETAGLGRTDLLIKVAQMETKFDALAKAVDGLQREVHGLARQMSAVTTSRRRGAVPPLADTMSED